MLNFIRHLLGSNRKRCLSRLIVLGYNMGVILIMAGDSRQSSRIMIFNNFLQKLMKCEKLRRWAVTRIWYFEGAFIGKVVRGHVDEMQIESRQVVWTYVFQCFWAILRSRPMFSHRNRPKPSKDPPPPPCDLGESGSLGNHERRGTMY